MCHDDETSDEQAREYDDYQSYIDRLDAANDATQRLCDALLAYAAAL